jgi:ATP-dependent Clp protease protease subunit
LIKSKFCNDCEEAPDFSYALANEETREIYLVGTVSEEMSSSVLPAIRQLDATKGAVAFIINSSGGEVDSGWAIYDAIHLMRNKTVAYCYGVCMSIATLILQACDQRVLAPNCRFMIHNGSVACDTSYAETVALINEVEGLSDRHHRVLAERSVISLDKIKKMCQRDTYMSAEEAVEFGFADGILLAPKKRRQK